MKKSLFRELWLWYNVRGVIMHFRGMAPVRRTPMWNAVDKLLSNAMTNGCFPGCAISAGQRGKVFYQKTFGYLTPSQLRPVTAETRYDAGSLTQVLATMPLALKAMESGLISPDDPVSRFVDGVPADKREITLENLLTHTSGLPGSFSLEHEARGAQHALKALLAHPLESAPGSKVRQSAMGYILLGFLMEKVFDMPLDDVLAHFGTTPQEKERIKDIYGNADGNQYVSSALQGDETRHLTFYAPSRSDLCRVILGWNLESRDAYLWNDTLHGTWGYLPYTSDSKQLLDIANAKRRERAQQKGISDADCLLIEYEYATERYWYYRYMSPYGDVLKEGRSPYWHGEHNYVLHLYPLVQGKLGNFVEQFIDQQRAINRTATLIDFIRGTSSKGVLVVDDDAFESMTREEVIDEYVRYNGVLFVKLKPGQSIDGVVRQYNSGAAVAGDFELLNLQLRLINEISGVNSAIQGQSPKAGTPASLYAQQVQNSSLNLKGLFDSFRTFRRRRDIKLMKTIQQYYTEQRYMDIAGTDYSEEAKWYSPQKVQNAEFDLTISEGYNTPAYQMIANDFLMELFRVQAVDVKTMLENSSYPFAKKILEAIKRNEEQAVNNAPMSGIPPELLSQLSAAQQQEQSLQ